MTTYKPDKKNKAKLKIKVYNTPGHNIIKKSVMLSNNLEYEQKFTLNVN